MACFEVETRISREGFSSVLLQSKTGSNRI